MTSSGKLRILIKDEEHWNYQNSIILFDRTRTLQEILNEITRYNEASRIDRLTRYYCDYWENTLGSLSCIEHGNHWGARIYTALAIQELIRLLFNFNHLWTPKLQWAFKEIHLLQAKPKNLQKQVESILKQPERGKQSRLWNQTAELLRKEKHSWVDHPEDFL